MIIADFFNLQGSISQWTPIEQTQSLIDDANDFNRQIKSCTEMLRWLDKKGILKDVSFRYRLENGKDAKTNEAVPCVWFALDSDDLLPFRNAMEESGIENADIACHLMFGDEGYKISPCIYSGAICVTWTMRTYRDIDGTVGRSWEIPDIQYLCTGDVCDIITEKEKNGAKAAVNLMWDIYDRLNSSDNSAEQ